MSQIKKGSQVILRQNLKETGNLIRLGEVVSIQGSKAQVFIPADRVRKEVPLSQLELASNRFSGRARVNIDPNRRNIS